MVVPNFFRLPITSFFFLAMLAFFFCSKLLHTLQQLFNIRKLISPRELRGKLCDFRQVLREHAKPPLLHMNVLLPAQEMLQLTTNLTQSVRHLTPDFGAVGDELLANGFVRDFGAAAMS